MTDEQRKEEIFDAQVRLFVAIGRMLKEAERVRNERERLLAGISHVDRNDNTVASSVSRATMQTTSITMVRFIKRCN